MTFSNSKPLLHLEVRLKNVPLPTRTDTICDEVERWVRANIAQMKIGSISDLDPSLTTADLEHADVIERIEIVDHSSRHQGRTFEQRKIFETEDVLLDVQAYQIYDSPAEPLTPEEEEHEGDGHAESPEARLTTLPNKALHGLWNMLVFEEDIPARLLRYLTKMMTLSKNPKLDRDVMNWNRLVLLYGPPGTGKTTLCMALAQKLSIRLGRHYTQSKLVQISSQSLLSRWFGQSGRLVSKMFEEIHRLAEDEDTLICVHIDEVESLTSSREKSANGNENNDALRATNQLLTGLDRLREQPNVLVLCTSNLLTSIDAAFLDRVDIKMAVPRPSPRAIYDILRSSLSGLVQCGAITVEEPETEEDAMSDGERTVTSTSDDWTVLPDKALPTFDEYQIGLGGAAGEKMWELAQKCLGRSGRALRRLPFSAIAQYTYTETCSIMEALTALEMVVDEEEMQEREGSLMTM